MKKDLLGSLAAAFAAAASLFAGHVPPRKNRKDPIKSIT
jgi:hypothetical protein